MALRYCQRKTTKREFDPFREQTGRIFLITLDLTMPVMGDEEAFDCFSAIRHDVPILLASGYHETDAVARTTDKDFAGFVQKAFDLDGLTEAATSALGLEEE